MNNKKETALQILNELRVQAAEDSIKRLLDVMICAVEAIDITRRDPAIPADLLGEVNQLLNGNNEVAELSHRPALKTSEAARLYGISKTTLEAWRCQGRGPRFFKDGKLILYRPRDIEAYLENGIVRTIDQP